MVTGPMLAIVFGGKLSSGIILPMLVFGDVLAVWYYHRHASWHHLKILFPWAALGTLLGTGVGNLINDETFRLIMGVVVLISIGIMVWMGRNREKDIPTHYLFGPTIGIAGGFTSMVGNMASSVMAIYFLSMQLPKNIFIGTVAWFFLVVNVFKVPFHVFSWHTISMETFVLNLSTIPFIALGAYLGIVVVSKIPEKYYRWFIIGMTLAAAIVMFF